MVQKNASSEPKHRFANKLQLSTVNGIKKEPKFSEQYSKLIEELHSRLDSFGDQQNTKYGCIMDESKFADLFSKYLDYQILLQVQRNLKPNTIRVVSKTLLDTFRSYSTFGNGAKKLEEKIKIELCSLGKKYPDIKLKLNEVTRSHSPFNGHILECEYENGIRKIIDDDKSAFKFIKKMNYK